MLASLFLFIEFYELIKYYKYDSNINLILTIITGELAAYTHYFAAISAGLFLLYSFAKFLLQGNYEKTLLLFFSGIFYAILYLPWMLVAKNQFSMATSVIFNLTN